MKTSHRRLFRVFCNFQANVNEFHLKMELRVYLLKIEYCSRKKKQSSMSTNKPMRKSPRIERIDEDIVTLHICLKEGKFSRNILKSALSSIGTVFDIRIPHGQDFSGRYTGRSRYGDPYAFADVKLFKSDRKGVYGSRLELYENETSKRPVAVFVVNRASEKKRNTYRTVMGTQGVGTSIERESEGVNRKSTTKKPKKSISRNVWSRVVSSGLKSNHNIMEIGGVWWNDYEFANSSSDILRTVFD